MDASKRTNLHPGHDRRFRALSQKVKKEQKRKSENSNLKFSDNCGSLILQRPDLL